MFYVGGTENGADQRFRQHLADSKRPSKQTVKLYKYMREHKESEFDIEELAVYQYNHKEERFKFEQDWIDTLHPPLNDKRAHGYDKEKRRRSKKRHYEKKKNDPRYKAAKAKACRRYYQKKKDQLVKEQLGNQTTITISKCGNVTINVNVPPTPQEIHSKEDQKDKQREDDANTEPCKAKSS